MSRRYVIPDEDNELLECDADYDAYYTRMGWTKVVVRDVQTKNIHDETNFMSVFTTYTQVCDWLERNTTKGWDIVYSIDPDGLLVLFIEDREDAIMVKLKWP